MNNPDSPKFRPGQLVFLCGKKEDFEPPYPPNEVANILEYEGDGMYMVEVPQHLRFNNDGVPVSPYQDDGLREVSEDQIYPISS